jgi:hypothetical protein
MSRHLSVSVLAVFLAVTGTAPTSAQQPKSQTLSSFSPIMSATATWGPPWSSERFDGRGGVCWTAAAQRRLIFRPEACSAWDPKSNTLKSRATTIPRKVIKGGSRRYAPNY